MNYRAVCFELLAERSTLKAKNKALLTTLEQVNQRLTSGSTESWQNLHMQVKAAIAKAKEGE